MTPNEHRSFLLSVAALGLAFALLASVACAPAIHDTRRVTDIPRVQPIEPLPVWRDYAVQLERCIGRKPVVPYDSIAWFLAPAGIPGERGARNAAYGFAGESFLATHTIALSTFGGGFEVTIKHELTHSMWLSETTAYEGRQLHDAKLFTKRCGNSITGGRDG